MKLEQHQSVMLQLYLSDQQVYCHQCSPHIRYLTIMFPVMKSCQSLYQRYWLTVFKFQTWFQIRVSPGSRTSCCSICGWGTVYPKKYAHGFVVLCFVVVMQSFIMNSHEVFIHIHQGCFAGTGAIVRLPQCQWSKPDGYGKISQCITTIKHSKAKTVCIFLGIYCFIACGIATPDSGWWTEYIRNRLQVCWI